VSSSSSSSGANHSSLMDSLRAEEVARRGLLQECADLEEQKRLASKTTTERESFLLGLPDRLKHLKDAALSLETQLGGSSSSATAALAAAASLPAPLLIAYRRLVSATAAHSESHVTIGRATTVLAAPGEDPVWQEAARRLRVSVEELFQLSPQCVELTVRDDKGATRVIRLSHLEHLGLVIAGEGGRDSPLVVASLVGFDQGMAIPVMAPHRAGGFQPSMSSASVGDRAMLLGLGDAVGPLPLWEGLGGRPYAWCQTLAGGSVVTAHPAGFTASDLLKALEKRFSLLHRAAGACVTDARVSPDPAALEACGLSAALSEKEFAMSGSSRLLDIMSEARAAQLLEEVHHAVLTKSSDGDYPDEDDGLGGLAQTLAREEWEGSVRKRAREPEAVPLATGGGSFGWRITVGSEWSVLVVLDAGVPERVAVTVEPRGRSVPATVLRGKERLVSRLSPSVGKLLSESDSWLPVLAVFGVVFEKE
jgi:hypothetical protein